MEAGFYGDTGRMIGFFYEAKQHRSRLVPGWVTAVLEFVEDPVSCNIFFFFVPKAMKDSYVFHRKMKLPYRLVIICSYAKSEEVFQRVCPIALSRRS